MDALSVGDAVRLRTGERAGQGRVLSIAEDDEGCWVLVEWPGYPRTAFLSQDLEKIESAPAAGPA